MHGIVKIQPEPGSIKYLELEDPSPTPDQVVIKVQAAGVCGTDISMFNWKPMWAKEYGPKLPIVMGHECAGKVVATGKTVRNFKAGDRVVPFPLIYCGICEYCLAGRPSICTNRPMLGAGLPGVFSDFFVVREKNVYPIPDGVPWDVAAVTEPMCVALHSLSRVSFQPGESIFVAGPGPIGFAIALAAIGSGAGQIHMSGLQSDLSRLQLADDIGINSINISSASPSDVILSITHGRGVDVAFEASGTLSGLDQCMSVVKRGGRIGMVGQGFTPASLAANFVSYREIDLIGIRGATPQIWQRSGAFFSRNVSLIKQLVTHRFPLSQGQEAFNLMKDGVGVKVLLIPGTLKDLDT